MRDILASMQKRYRDQRAFYQVNSAVIPTTRGDEAWWQDRDRVKTAEARQGNAQLAFIGDSITQGWETVGQEVWQKYYAHRQSINLGFSGDRTEHVIWRLQHGNLASVHPQVAVLLIGTNNTGHLRQSPEEVAAGVERILDVLAERSPETRILLLGVFPRGALPDDLDRLNNVAINQYLRRMDDDRRVFYRDIGHIFLDERGALSQELMPDYLHLSPSGYRLWAEAMEPILKDLGV